MTIQSLTSKATDDFWRPIQLYSARPLFAVFATWVLVLTFRVGLGQGDGNQWSDAQTIDYSSRGRSNSMARQID